MPATKRQPAAGTRSVGAFLRRLFRRETVAGTGPTDPRVEQALKQLQAGRPDRAEQACRQILSVDPQHAEAHGLLGRICAERGRFDAAFRHYAAAISLDPQQASLRQGLGAACVRAGRIDDGIRHFEEAIALAPRDPVGHASLGDCLREGHRLDEAVACYRRAIAAGPDYAPAHVNLADVLRQQGRFAEAEKAARRGLRSIADCADLHFELAEVLGETARYDEALKTLLAVADAEDGNADFHYQLARVYSGLRRPDEAIASYREAIARRPGFVLAHNNLGYELLVRNEIEDAAQSFRKAVALQPDLARIHSNLLFIMNYAADSTQKKIFEKSAQFDLRLARRLTLAARAFENERDPARVLRVGYMSPDFREHSVAHFTRKLIGAHNRECLEVYCYADVARPDDMTRQFEAQCDHWRSLVGLPDAAVAELVREDGIDILVDLAGHSSDNRLLVFARRPAPVQVTWLGYPNTTGLRAMDYRLTDAVADPPGEADRLHSEELVRLDGGFLCYQGDEAEPPVSPLPCATRGFVTLGTFNTTRKITAEVIATWAAAMKALPESRLLLKSDSLDDPYVRNQLLARFAAHDIGPERLELHGFIKERARHLALYGGIDIGLDPFPYNGTTTTCEALWMGVPVVVLLGNRHAGRVGASIMQQVGLADRLVARSRDDYIARVVSLAGDRDGLGALRASLRQRMGSSPLMDVERFAGTLENAYRAMWVRWCEAGKPARMR